MNHRIVLIGAGSAAFGLGTVGDILKCEPLQGSTIVLHDINAQSLDRVQAIARRYIQEHELPYRLVATTSRPEALRGADFCVIAIEVGDRFRLWEQDWKIPLQFGFRQIMGENGGPGGLFHSLRIIPPILEICRDINAICPDAFIVNFSNPMSRICLAIKRKYPDLRFVGICHEAASLLRHLPAILETPLSNIRFKAGGLNHFSVLLEVAYDDTGADAYPDLRQRAAEYFENLPSLVPATEGQSVSSRSDAGWADRGVVKVVLEHFGYLPATEDSHFGEYVHWAHEVADHRGVARFYEFYRELVAGHVHESRIEGTHEEEHVRIVNIVEGMVTDSHHQEIAVNIPNTGLIDNLPQDLVVEVPGVIDGKGVHGVRLGDLPKGIAALLSSQARVQDLVVEAACKGSRELALQALLVDPVVDSVWRAEDLLDTMLELQQPHLDYLD